MNAREATVVTNRGVTFTGESVLSIIAGTKTQSRRIIKPQPVRSLPNTKPLEGGGDEWEIHRPLGWHWQKSKNFHVYVADQADSTFAENLAQHCPYGNTGGLIYVKESWRTWERESDRVDGFLYQADNGFKPIENTREAAEKWVGLHDPWRRAGRGGTWRSSRHMPRWASRITLELLSVRAQRLHDITEADIIAEGVTVDRVAKWCNVPWSSMPTLHDAWQVAWNHINGERAPWASNPWVWVLCWPSRKGDSHERAR